MPEVVKMGEIKTTVPVIFFGQNDGKVVTFRFEGGTTPEGTQLGKGEWIRYFPGETDLAGREVSEKLRNGVLETYIFAMEEDAVAVLSVTESAVGAIRKAIEESGRDVDNPEEWTDLVFTMQRKGTQTWKVSIKEMGELEGKVKEALKNCEGETYANIDELALKVGLEIGEEDFDSVKEVLTSLKGRVYSLGKNGLKLKK
ncbi:MAG: hypothetical protein FHOMOCKG_00012 [Methanophagales virus GBV302]|uniref:Uncharacterized protein n=1 Tax=Methanophagales virus GBV302 TaxID=2999281 RepID=A0A9E8VD14_9CAUD|nr:MAG: hypothetical protein QIT37_gp012 [Methanophagales virus GBV302]WAE39540.1 MAG: hypothetical protein FHOMOCKG_00012 [Methanophagales virus GBV302]